MVVADLDGGNGAQKLWTVAVGGGCGTTAAAVRAAMGHSNCGRWQRTAALEWDATGCTNSERLLLWTTTVAVPAETAHGNCERWQRTAAVEWKNNRCIDSNTT